MDDRTRSQVDWVQVLARIEETLQRSLEEAAEPAAPRPALLEGAGPLRQLDERLARWAACLEQADRGAAEAQSGLTAEMDALLAWVAGVRAARQALEAWREQQRNEGSGGVPPAAAA